MEEEIKKVLKGFFTEMNEWERFCAEADPDFDEEIPDDVDTDKIEAEKKQRLDAIFARYCTPKERKHGRVGMYQKPPEYNPNEEILEINFLNPKKADAVTQAKSGLRHKNKYTLFYKNDCWLIDYKEYWSALDDKWVKAIL